MSTENLKNKLLDKAMNEHAEYIENLKTLPPEKILELQCNNPANMDSVMNPSRKYRRTRKKMN